MDKCHGILDRNTIPVDYLSMEELHKMLMHVMINAAGRSNRILIASVICCLMQLSASS